MTPQSQQVLEDGMGGAMMNVNIPQVRGGHPGVELSAAPAALP